ncbi:GNAT family N-acetyltransferase [Bacillus coahuilensis]|uniref:GNAT family N-acetyltransferase n=1 Tax=Bacillus coahuilensis TaxID=408580 RepID=UPI000B323260|nr:GNAT family N-acetyltransferase [Bacillus coahuilensis]
MVRIRKGKKEDLPVILEIVEDTVAIMDSNGNDQWTDEYPVAKDFIDDIESENLYVAVNEQDKPIGMITVDQEQAEEYEGVKEWRKDVTRPFVFHRIAVDLSTRGAGIASKLIAHAEHVAKEAGVYYMRTDTYIKNKKAQKLFEKMAIKK